LVVIAGQLHFLIRRIVDHYAASNVFHAYDSFAGLPPKKSQDQNAAGVDFAAGELTVSKKQFLRNFERAKLKPPVTHKAWFNELTDADVPRPIAFAFLDGDFYDSIYTSLELVWPRLAPEAKVLVHDYNRETLPGVAQAIHDFCRAHQLTPKIRGEAHIAIIEA
jgi:O-methyltransferase